MEKRKRYKWKWTGFIFIPLVIIIGVSFFLSQGKKEHTTFNPDDLTFGDNYISYIASDSETISINLWAVQNVNDKNKDTNFSNYVKELAFNNNNMKIVNYEFQNMAEYEGKRLIQLDISMQLNSHELEKADQCTLIFKNNEKKSYKFGKMKMKYVPNTKNSDIVVDHFPVRYKKPDLSGMIKNASHSPIKLNSIYDVGNVVHYELGGTTISPRESKELNPSDIVVSETYDFYSISPILDYTIDGVRKNAYLPQIVYGIGDEDIDKIKKIVEQ